MLLRVKSQACENNNLNEEITKSINEIATDSNNIIINHIFHTVVLEVISFPFSIVKLSNFSLKLRLNNNLAAFPDSILRMNRGLGEKHS